MMREILSSLFLVGGGFFALVAGLGLLRFRDLHSRMHAATKASGAAFLLVLAAEVLRVPGWESLIKAAVAMGFAFLTLPVAAHLLGRTTQSPVAIPEADDSPPLTLTETEGNVRNERGAGEGDSERDG